MLDFNICICVPSPASNKNVFSGICKQIEDTFLYLVGDPDDVPNHVTDIPVSNPDIFELSSSVFPCPVNFN